MDCLEGMKEIPSKSIELALTDIPYGVVSRPSHGIRVFDKDTADVSTFTLDGFLSELCRTVRGSIYVFCSTEQVSDIRRLLIEREMTTRLCIWEKSNPSPVNGQHLWLSGVECCIFGRFRGAVFNEHCKNTVWKFPVGSSKVHPTQKPLKLFEYLVGVSSNLGDTVLDPCMGSGTTAVSCINTGRNFIGFETDPKYYQICLDRIAAARGEQKAA
jgi:DNA modification methylase